MTIYFKESGRDKPETIIFLHELNMAGWMWDEQVKAFSDYHCIVPDLPDHGKSINNSPFTIKNAAGQVRELIKEKVQKGRAHLVGISIGAQVILQILNDTPERVESAFISGALVNNSQPSDNFLELFDYLLDSYIPVKDHHLSIGSYIRCYGIPKNQRRNFIKSTHAIKSNIAREALIENILFKIPDKLDKTDIPVLIMAGEKDHHKIKESASILSGVLSNSKAFLAPRVGHVWNMENPELFNDILRSWITGLSFPDSLIEISTLNLS